MEATQPVVVALIHCAECSEDGASQTIKLHMLWEPQITLISCCSTDSETQNNMSGKKTFLICLLQTSINLTASRRAIEKHSNRIFHPDSNSSLLSIDASGDAIGSSCTLCDFKQPSQHAILLGRNERMCHVVSATNGYCKFLTVRIDRGLPLVSKQRALFEQASIDFLLVATFISQCFVRYNQ